MFVPQFATRLYSGEQRSSLSWLSTSSSSSSQLQRVLISASISLLCYTGSVAKIQRNLSSVVRLIIYLTVTVYTVQYVTCHEVYKYNRRLPSNADSCSTSSFISAVSTNACRTFKFVSLYRLNTFLKVTNRQRHNGHFSSKPRSFGRPPWIFPSLVQKEKKNLGV